MWEWKIGRMPVNESNANGPAKYGTDKLPLPKSCATVIVEMRITHTPGVVIFADLNTTIGYCRYTEEGAVEYIFVSRVCRRRGYAKQLLKLVEERVRCKLCFQMPVSTLGEKLQASYDQSSRILPDPGIPDADMNPNSIPERPALELRINTLHKVNGQ